MDGFTFCLALYFIDKLFATFCSNQSHVVHDDEEQQQQPNHNMDDPRIIDIQECLICKHRIADLTDLHIQRRSENMGWLEPCGAEEYYTTILTNELETLYVNHAKEHTITKRNSHNGYHSD